jgi:hypothetical protein
MKSRKCPKCENTKLLKEFYSRRGKKGNSVYCKVCSNNQVVKRQRDFKEKCVKYKGDKCILCGYKRCISGLEFHHRDPGEKDFTISKFRLTSWKKNEQIIKKELDKCDLVCRNCHSEIHYNMPHRIDTKPYPNWQQ